MTLNSSINIFERKRGSSFMYLDDLKYVLNDLVSTINLRKQRAPSHAKTLVSLKELLSHKLLSELANANTEDKAANFIKYSFILYHRSSVYFLANALHAAKDEHLKRNMCM